MTLIYRAQLLRPDLPVSLVGLGCCEQLRVEEGFPRCRTLARADLVRNMPGAF